MTRSVLGRVLGTLMVGMKETPIPLRLFDAEPAAEAWLLERFDAEPKQVVLHSSRRPG